MPSTNRTPVPNRPHELGAHVVFVDEKGAARDALVTRWWHGVAANMPQTEASACNLVVVSRDEHRHDDYGRKLDRATSVLHRSNAPAGAVFWCWPDEAASSAAPAAAPEAS